MPAPPHRRRPGQWDADGRRGSAKASQGAAFPSLYYPWVETGGVGASQTQGPPAGPALPTRLAAARRQPRLTSPEILKFGSVVALTQPLLYHMDGKGPWPRAAALGAPLPALSEEISSERRTCQLVLRSRTTLPAVVGTGHTPRPVHTLCPSLP